MPGAPDPIEGNSRLVVAEHLSGMEPTVEVVHKDCVATV